jgi:hypothetical protein
VTEHDQAATAAAAVAMLRDIADAIAETARRLYDPPEGEPG